MIYKAKINITKKINSKGKDKSEKELIKECIAFIKSKKENENEKENNNENDNENEFDFDNIDVFNLNEPIKEIKKNNKIFTQYCFCGDIMGEKEMICCDGCNVWYHIDCVGISLKEFENLKKDDQNYICYRCNLNS